MSLLVSKHQKACHQPILTPKPTVHELFKQTRIQRKSADKQIVGNVRATVTTATCACPNSTCFFLKILQHASDSTLWTVALCALSAWVGPGPKFRLAVKWAAKWSQSESDSKIFCKLDDMAHASCNVSMLTKCLDQHGGPTAPEHLVHSHFLSQGQNNYNYLSQSLQSTVPWKSTNICIQVASVESWSVPARWLTLDLKKIHPIERESKFKSTKLHFPSFK